MVSGAKVYYLSLLLGMAVTSAGFLLGYWLPFLGVPLMVLFLGPSIFLNSKALLTMTSKRSLQLGRRLLVIIDTLVLDCSLAAMGFLLIIKDFGGLNLAFFTFGVAVLVGLISNPARIRIVHAPRQETTI